MSLFAKVHSTSGEFSGGWLDFVQRWLVLVGPVTLNIQNLSYPRPRVGFPADCEGIGIELSIVFTPNTPEIVRSVDIQQDLIEPAGIQLG